MIKSVVEKRPMLFTRWEGRESSTEVWRRYGLFTELKGNERRIQQIFVENLSLPGNVLSVKTKTKCLFSWSSHSSEGNQKIGRSVDYLPGAYECCDD